MTKGQTGGGRTGPKSGRAPDDALRTQAMPSKALRAAFASNPMAIGITDLSTGRVIEVNEAFTRLTGCSREELIGRTTPDLALWADAEQRARYLEAIATTGKAEGFVARLRRKDGTIRLVTLDGSVVRGPGARAFIASFVRDVTEENRLRKELEESEDRYRRITQSITDYIYTVHIRGGEVVRTAHSPACEAVTGYTPEEFDRDPFLWYTMVHEDDREAVRDHFNRVCTGELTQPIEHRIRRKDGQIRWVSNMPVIHRDASGVITRYDGVISDITLRKTAELETRDSNERFKALSEASFGGIGIHDRGLILDCNQGLSDITGYTREELIGMDGLNLIAPAWRNHVMEKILSGYDKPYDVLGLRKDGTTYPLEIRGKNIPYHGRIVRVTEFRDITSRVQAEESVRSSEERLRLISELTGKLVYDIDITTGVHTWHGAVTAITGYSPEEFSGFDMRAWADLIHPDDRADVIGTLEEALGAGSPFRAEYRIRKKDGEVVYVEDHGAFIADATGRPVRMLGSIGDITERKTSELRLKESEERYRSLFHNTHAVMLLVDPETASIVDANPAACAYYGYTHEELTARKITGINTMNPQEVFAEMELARTRGKNSFLFRHRLASGEIRDVEVFSGPITVAGRTLLYSIVHDITDRRIAEEALRQSETRFRSILRNIADIIVILDDKGRITFATPSLERTLGYPEGHVAGLSPLELVHPDDRDLVARDLGEVYEGTNDGLPTEFRALRADGSWMHLEAIGGRLKGQPDIEGIIITARDITERKRAQELALEMERRVLHTQRLESLGVMAGGIAHDFNNLLMAIIGNLDLARLGIPESSRTQTFLENAMTAARRAAHLTSQMLAYSGKGVFDLRTFDLNELITETQLMLRASVNKKVSLVTRTTSGPLHVRADPGQIRQVLMNLVINAAEAIGEKPGMITVTTGEARCSDEDLSRSRLAWKAPEGDYVTLEVSDTGCGMDDQTLERVFDPFFSTKFTGRGLGMAAVSGIVTGHHGAVMIDSQPGEGTTVRVLLPRWTGEPERENGGGEAVRISGNRCGRAGEELTVLVADDDEMVRNACASMLERMGFRVLRRPTALRHSRSTGGNKAGSRA